LLRNKKNLSRFKRKIKKKISQDLKEKLKKKSSDENRILSSSLYERFFSKIHEMKIYFR
jgi:hypothetical protein